MNNSLKNSLTSLPFIKTIQDISLDLRMKVYLVGGIIRDSIPLIESVRGRGRESGAGSLDLDFAVDGDALLFGKKAGDAVKGSYFPLDKERSVSRVVVKKPEARSQKPEVNKEIILDFSRIRGEEIEDDLKHRDFTINSIAVSLSNLFGGENLILIDPTGGIKDIEKGVIRVYDKKALYDDPLRMLRAVRFESQLCFTIAGDLGHAIRENSPTIKHSAGERVRDELFKILSCKESHKYIQKLKELRLLKEIIPEIEAMENIDQGRHHKYPLWDHSLNTIKTIEMLMENLSRVFPEKYLQIEDMLSDMLEHGIQCREILKLSALIHDIGKPTAKRVDEYGEVRFINHEKFSVEIGGRLGERLKLGNNACNAMSSIVRNHMRPLLLSKENKVTNRAIFRFFKDTRRAGVFVCLLSIADIHATRGSGIFDDTAADIEGLVRRMIDFYLDDFVKQVDSPLLSGDEVMERLGLKSGPDIGEILKEIEDRRAEGIISNKEEAINFITRFRRK
ncbi:MAG: HD domain-containing protein [Nitrospinae bacterium]|nr:HD domain-containing protein [Nitrospinota bacterium]